MVFKLRAASWSLIFTACFFITILWAAESTIPLPADALKVSENTTNFGPIKSVTRIYQSSLTPAKVESFYKKEMLRSGWTNRKEGVFIKNNYIVVITVNPLKDKAGKIHFSNTISNIPAKEEFLALHKTKPDKLNFMPIYPGSVQVLLWDLPTGVTVSYETKSSIKEVVFFYKSGMLDYGWSLDNETPIKAGVIDCPGCRKASRGVFNTANSKAASTKSTASLIFRRKDGESCTITISNIFIDPGDLAARGKPDKDKSVSLPSKTTISVTYNAYKRIK
ncbi:MAG: hypothetical protein Q8N80_06305 [Candidatus Omnitrophota bacterium]|nr:hypothetical protein [Candidatus Omnitrophota bacterium]